MIFSQPRCAPLFIMTLIAFFAGPRRWRLGVLVISGLIFYAWADSTHLPLILLLVLCTGATAGGSAGVWLNVAALVGFLAYFKLRGGFGVFPGIQSSGAMEQTLLLPLGLSFLSFELIHYCIERRRGTIRRSSLAGLAAFALYFPCRIAGPIKRYQPFIESVRESRWSLERAYRGGVRILIGFVKKVALADVLALIVPELSYAQSSLQVWKGVLAYAFYLYLDFSAYSDIAIGMSTCFGLRVPENFRWPYLSRNIREFWTRWHMSFSSWLADYLFLPISKRLAGSPARLPPKAAVILGYLVTFTLCGLWHGPSLNFLLWGLYHGVLLSGYALYRESGGWLARLRLRSVALEFGTRIVATAGTFVAVTVGWVLFLVPTPQALTLMCKLVRVGG